MGAGQARGPQPRRGVHRVPQQRGPSPELPSSRGDPVVSALGWQTCGGPGAGMATLAGSRVGIRRPSVHLWGAEGISLGGSRDPRLLAQGALERGAAGGTGHPLPPTCFTGLAASWGATRAPHQILTPKGLHGALWGKLRHGSCSAKVTQSKRSRAGPHGPPQSSASAPGQRGRARGLSPSAAQDGSRAAPARPPAPSPLQNPI